jgi:ankyrin repeat protein
VKLLLAKDGVDPDFKDTKYSRTPLSLAAGRGREAVVKLPLEEAGVDPDSKDSGRWTPLVVGRNAE